MKLGQVAQDRIAAFVNAAAADGFAGLQKADGKVKADASVQVGDAKGIVADGTLYVQHQGTIYEVGQVANVLPELAGVNLFARAQGDKHFVAGDASSTQTRGRGVQTTHTLLAKVPDKDAKPLTLEQRRALAKTELVAGLDALTKKVGAQYTGGLSSGAQKFWVDVAKTGSIGFEHIPAAARDNLAVVAAWLKQNPSDYTFKSVGAALRDNEALARLLLAVDGEALEHCSARLRGQKDVVLVAVSESGEGALEHASKELRGDLDVARAAVRNTPYAYRFVEAPAKNDKALIREYAIGSWSFSDHITKEQFAALAKDKSFVLEHVAQNPRAVRDRLKDWRGDDDVMRVAIKGDPEMLEFASDALKKDAALVKAAVHGNARAYEFADKSVAAREDVMLAALSGKEGWVSAHEMQKIPEAAARFADKAFVMKAIPLQERVFWMAKSFHADRDVVMHAMKHFGGLSFAKKFAADPKVAKAAVDKNPGEIRYVSSKAPNYEQLAKQALQADPHNLWSLPRKIDLDRTMIERLVKYDAALLNNVDAKWARDPSIIKIVADASNVHSSVLVERCKGDRDAVLALAQSKTFFEYYGAEAASLLKGFTGDKDIMLGVIRQNAHFFEKAGAKLKRDPDFVMACVKANGDVLRQLGKDVEGNRELVMAALKGDVFRVDDWGNTLDLSRWLGDKAFAKELLAENGARLRDLSPALRDDRELVALACKQAWRNVTFASDAIRTDAAFLATLKPVA